MIDGTGAVRVPVPGTPVQILLSVPNYQAVTGKAYPIHAILFEALPANTGRVYIGKQGLDKGTFVRCLAWLAVPTLNNAPSFAAAITIAPNALIINDFWIDADNATDGVLATYLIL